jgi:FAD:protein FMN transferase
MNEPLIHVFRHYAMATEFEVRVADAERTYAAQAALAAFALADELESLLSRFRMNSEISQIAQLATGELLRLSDPVFACLRTAKEMESATQGGFSITAAALQTQPAAPQWSLIARGHFIRCDSGRLEFDLGAIGKGFALDRMAALLREWECDCFLLNAGGSSVMAGAAPPGSPGWSCGLGDDGSEQRFWLHDASLSGSGLAVKGRHILDPRSGAPALRPNRAWALAESAAQSDALSTACMVLEDVEIEAMVRGRPRWLVVLKEGGGYRQLGDAGSELWKEA